MKILIMILAILTNARIIANVKPNIGDDANTSSNIDIGIIINTRLRLMLILGLMPILLNY